MKSHCRILEISIVFSAVALTNPVLANPVGETVGAGRATFDRSLPGRLTINQGSDRLIVNWRDFSIGLGETTRFLQPSASSAVLNRVVTDNPSQLLGHLESNGRVFLINPNGVLVGRGATINTRGFVASTLDVSDASFLSGAKLTLSGASTAPVVNQGSIQAIGGDVFLIGRTVENSGTLRASSGTVGMAAGSEVLIVPSGAERLSVIAGAPAGSPADKGVNNVGTIESVAAELKAAGGNIYALAINNSGILRATGVRNENGRVLLTSEGGNIENSGTLSAHNANGSGGQITVDGGHNSSGAPSTVLHSGSIDATGAGRGTQGGEVQVLGDHVGLVGSALVDVSGNAGGGTALIGGDLRGSNPDVGNAQRTFVGSEAQIRADALQRGDGGKVIVWSDDTTRFYGHISARGGPRGGDGGFSEVSGKNNLDFLWSVDLTAAHGQPGTLLLDPDNIVIQGGTGDGDDPNSATALLDRSPTDGRVLFADVPATFTVFESELEGTAQDIILEAGTSITTAGTFGGNAVVLQSGRDLTMRTRNDNSLATPDGNGGIDLTSAGANPTLEFRTQGAGLITLQARTGTGVGNTGVGDITVGKLTTANHSISITTGNGNVSIGDSVDAGTANVTITANGGNIHDVSTDTGTAHIKGDIVNLTVTGAGSSIGASATDTLEVDAQSLIAASGGGNIFLTEINGLSALNLDAGAGDVLLKVLAGGVADTDGAADITAANAAVILSDVTPQNFGASADPIQTSVDNLSVDTSAGGGSQFITEANGLTGLNLNAGAGDVNLTLTLGTVADADGSTDLSAANATVLLSDGTAQNFGSLANPIHTSVGSLSVDTSAGDGSQFITEANGVTALNLNAGAGDVNLTLTLGGVADADASADITAVNATVLLSDLTSQNFGASGNPIHTKVNDLSVDTSAGGGIQFITEANGLTGLNLNAGAGDVNLTLTLGGVTDADAAADITAANTTVVLSDASAQNFGSSVSPINTSVGGLRVNTSAGGGSQFITEANGLTTLNLNAGAGNVNLALTLGGVADADGSADITAANATVILSDATAQNFGASANPIDTSVGTLNVDTSAGGGSQFITEANGLTALNLNAGAGDVNLTLTLGALADADASADITAANATVLLSDPTSQNFGSSGSPINTSVASLSVNTSAGGGNQFIAQANGLTALDLNAGAGNVNLTVGLGSVQDADASTDITAANTTVILGDATAQDFGASANPIHTSVGGLNVDTSAGGGSQFTTEANGLTALNLNAGVGSVNLTLTQGAVADTDGATDITAANATVVLSDVTAQNFGASANHIHTSVDDLNVDTSAGGGSQFIREANGLTGLNLNAGAGDVNLTVTLGAVADADASTDITAANATVLLSDGTVQNFGALANPIQTSVGSLSVDTSAGDGSQFITEADGLTGLNLKAGAGDVILTLTQGGVADADGSADIAAANAIVILTDATAQDFGSLANPINTSVGGLSVDTSAGGGNQFVTEANGLTGLNLNAGAGDVNLTLTQGGVADADGATDITAANATVILSDAASQDFGSLANPINTSVGGLSVDTSAGDGHQFITEANGLTALNLNAGAGDVNLVLTLGGVTDADVATDLAAAHATVLLSEATARDFGASSSPIQTSVGALDVDTSAGGGSQFITEANGLTALNLNAGAGDVNLALTLGAVADADGSADITAAHATVLLSDATAQNFGTSGNPIGTTVGALSVNTSAGGGNQFIAQANGLTALDLNAGAGNVNLAVALGSVQDADASTDITAANTTVILGDATAQDFGTSANAIQTSVGGLNVDTSVGGGSQFISEANGLTALNLNAGAGNVNLTLALGAVADTDGPTDITAANATVTLSDPTAKDFGASGNPIATSVDGLNLDTSAGGGSQFVTEANGLTALDLNAGAGNVNLTLALGAVADTDGSADITAANTTVILSDATAQGFGALGNAINTSVGGLSVDTSAGGGSQFIAEANGLTALNLDAGAGDANLTLALGSVLDTDPAADITAANAVVSVSGAGNNIGSAANLIDIAGAGGPVTLNAPGGGTHVRVPGSGDINFTSSTDNGPNITTTFTSGTRTFAATYAHDGNGDLSVQGGGNINSAVTVLAPSATLTLNAGGSIGNGSGGYFQMDAGKFAGSAGSSLVVHDSSSVTLGAVSTTAGNLIVQADNTLNLDSGTMLDAHSGTVVLAGTVPGINIAVGGTPTIAPGSRFLFYAASARLTVPVVVGTTLTPFLANKVILDRPFNPNDPIPASFGAGNALIFVSSDRPISDPSLFIDIPVEVYRPVSISFGEYDPTKFGEVGDLWMSSSELYEIERKAGLAPKPVPEKVDRMKYVSRGK